MVYQISATDNTQEKRLLADSHIYFQQIKLKGLIETSELFEIYVSIIYASSLGRGRETLQVFFGLQDAENNKRSQRRKPEWSLKKITSPVYR